MKRKQGRWLGMLGAVAILVVYFAVGMVYEVRGATGVYTYEMSVVQTEDGNFYMVKNGEVQSKVIRFGADGIVNAVYTEDNICNILPLAEEKTRLSGIMTTDGNDVYLLRERVNKKTNYRVSYDLLRLREEGGKLEATNIYTKQGENLPKAWSIGVEGGKLFLSSIYTDNKTAQVDEFDIKDDGALFLRSSKKYINSNDEPIIKAMYLKGSVVMMAATHRIYVVNSASEKIVFPQTEEGQDQNLVSFSTVNGANLFFDDARDDKVYNYNILTDTTTSQNLSEFIHSNEYVGDDVIYVSFNGKVGVGVAVATVSTYDKLEVIFWNDGVLRKVSELKMPWSIALSCCTNLALELYIATAAVVLSMLFVYHLMNKSKKIVFRFIRITVIFVGCLLLVLGVIEQKILYSQACADMLGFASELNQHVLDELPVKDVEILNQTHSSYNESYKRILDKNILNSMCQNDETGFCFYNHLMILNSQKDLLMGPSEFDEFLISIEDIYSSDDCSLFYSALEGNKPVSGTVQNYYGDWLVCAQPVFNSSGETVGVLATLVDIDSLNSRIASAIGEYILIAASSLLALTLLIFVFFKKVLKPLSELTSSFKEVAAGNYAVRMVGMANDEFASINSTFNKMCEEISNSVYNLKKIKGNYNKFVPSCVYKMFNETDIGKINVGDFVEDDCVFVVQSIEASGLEAAYDVAPNKAVEHASRVFKLANKCARDSGGVLLSNGLGVEISRAIFGSDGAKAVDYSLNLRGSLKKGLEDAEHLNTVMIIHKSKTMFGISGDESTAFPVVNSEGAQELTHCLFKLRGAGVKVLATDSVLDDIKGIYNLRYLGFVGSGDSGQKHKIFEILDGCDTPEKSKKIVTKKPFETGISLFYGNSFYKARQEFSKVLQENPEDHVARWYLLMCDRCCKNPNLTVSYELFSGSNI